MCSLKLIIFLQIIFVNFYTSYAEDATTKKPIHLGKPGGRLDKIFQEQQELLDLFGGNVTEIYEAHDDETLSTLLQLLPESKAAVNRSLQEEAYKAFISYSNHRYQHCWNVSTAIPPHVYADAVKCSAKALNSGFKTFNKTLNELVGVANFLNNTINRLNQCREHKKATDPNAKVAVTPLLRAKRSLDHLVRHERSLRSRGKQFITSSAKFARKVGTRLVRYATIVGKAVQERTKRLRAYMEAKYIKMRTRMRKVAQRVLDRFRPMAQRTVKVAKVTAKYIQQFYCYTTALNEIYTNASTIVEDFIDTHDVLAKTKDEVRDCVSQKIDNYQGVLCSSGIPNYTDMDEMENYYEFEDVHDEF